MNKNAKLRKKRTVHYVEQSTMAESTAAGSADGESQADDETGAHQLDKTDQDAALGIIQACKFNISERDNFLEIHDRDTKNSRHLIMYQVISLLLQTKEHSDEVTAVTMLIDLDTTNPIFKIIDAKNKTQLSEDDKSTGYSPRTRQRHQNLCNGHGSRLSHRNLRLRSQKPALEVSVPRKTCRQYNHPRLPRDRRPALGELSKG